MICKQSHNLNLHGRREILAALKERKEKQQSSAPQVEELQNEKDWLDINTVSAASKESVNIIKLNLSATNSDYIINHTAVVDAVKPSYNNTQLVTLYFDNGSDYSVISKDCAKKLDLEIENGAAELTFKTVTGQSDHTKQTTQIL